MTLEAAKKSGSTDFTWMEITEVSMGVGRGGCGRGDSMEQKTIPGNPGLEEWDDRPGREHRNHLVQPFHFSQRKFDSC